MFVFLPVTATYAHKCNREERDAVSYTKQRPSTDGNAKQIVSERERDTQKDRDT